MHLKMCTSTHTKYLRCFVPYTSGQLHDKQYSLSCAEITHRSKMSLLRNSNAHWHHHKTHHQWISSKPQIDNAQQPNTQIHEQFSLPLQKDVKSQGYTIQVDSRVSTW